MYRNAKKKIDQKQQYRKVCDCVGDQVLRMFSCLCFFVSADPNLILPVGLLLGAATFLFILGVLTYRLFEMDLVLWLRSAFPVLYANTGGRRLVAAIGDVPPFPACMQRLCHICKSYCSQFSRNEPNVWGKKKKLPAAKVVHAWTESEQLAESRVPFSQTWPRVNVEMKQCSAS